MLQVSNPKDIMGAEKLIFPGVGAFEQAMGVLRSKEYTEPLKEFIQVHSHDSLHIARARMSEAAIEAPRIIRCSIRLGEPCAPPQVLQQQTHELQSVMPAGREALPGHLPGHAAFV